MEVTRKAERSENFNVNATLYNLKPTEKAKRLKYPMVLSPSSRIQYFEAEQPFSIMNLVSNPMVGMIGFTILMMFCINRMPKPGTIYP